MNLNVGNYNMNYLCTDVTNSSTDSTVDIPDMEKNDENKTIDNTYKDQEQICEVRKYLNYKTISRIKLINKKVYCFFVEEMYAQCNVLNHCRILISWNKTKITIKVLPKRVLKMWKKIQRTLNKKKK